MAPLSSLTGRITAGFSVSSAQINITGAAYTPVGTSLTINKTQSYGTASTNAQSGGCDEVFSFQQGITSGNSATISLITMTDLLQRASTAIVRIKGYMIRLLSATDDSTISPAPTATSTVTVTNIGPATPAPLDFSNGGSGLTVALTGSGAFTGVSVGASGSGYPPSTFFLASPQQSGGSGGVFLATTNASGNVSAVTFITGAGGAGYTAATVPAIPVGQYNILTGGAHLYLDPSSTGFCVVSATACNIKVVNMDGSHSVTIEVDVFGATT